MNTNLEAWASYVSFWIWAISIPPLFMAAKRLQELARIDRELARTFCEVASDCGRTGAGWIIGIITQLKTLPIIMFTLLSVTIAALVPPFMNMKPLGILLWLSIAVPAVLILTKAVKVLDTLKDVVPRRARELCGEA